MKKVIILLIIAVLIVFSNVFLYSQNLKDRSGWENINGILKEKLHTNEIKSIKFSNDNERIFTTTIDGCLYEWSLDSGKLLNKYYFPDIDYTDIMLSRDDKYALLYNEDGSPWNNYHDSTIIYKVELKNINNILKFKLDFDDIDNSFMKFPYNNNNNGFYSFDIFKLTPVYCDSNNLLISYEILVDYNPEKGKSTGKIDIFDIKTGKKIRNFSSGNYITDSKFVDTNLYVVKTNYSEGILDQSGNYSYYFNSTILKYNNLKFRLNLNQNELIYYDFDNSRKNFMISKYINQLPKISILSLKDTSLVNTFSFSTFNLVYSKNDKYLIASIVDEKNQNSTINIIDINSGLTVDSVLFPNKTTSFKITSANDSTIALAGSDGSIRIYKSNLLTNPALKANFYSDSKAKSNW